MTRMTETSVRFGTIIVFFVLMVILNLLSASSCRQLVREKCKMERELVRLEDARLREMTRWEGMKTPEAIERALVMHGLSMHLPRPDQVVRMTRDGTPRPGQLSLARAKARQGLNMAAVRPASRSASARRVR